jgi:hypothetical protein
MKHRLLILLLALPWAAWGQARYQAGWLPAVNLHKKLPKGWAANFKSEFRGEWRAGTLGEPASSRQGYLLTDLSAQVARKVGVRGWALGGGGLMRLRRQGEPVWRSIQQASITQRLPRFSLGHRIVTDQTFATGRAAVWRLRYRAAAAFPLRGAETDAREAYFKLGNEYLGIKEGPSLELEIRLLPMLGYEINDRNKLEVGLDYRLQGLGASHRFWLSANWFLSW